MNKKQQIFLIALLVFALDQFSKYWLVEIFALPAKAPVVITANFSLVMAWNRGVSFSMFAHSAAWMPWMLLAVALIISLILIRLALKTDRTLDRIAYAMVVGGAMGNALDRVRFGAVVDFLYAHIDDLGWPAFNVADSAICVGVGLLMFGMLRRPDQK